MSRDERRSEIERMRGQYGYAALPHAMGEQLMELPDPQPPAAAAEAS